MRDLFVSEQRYIRNLLWHWTKTKLKSFDPIVTEYYAPPRSSSGIRFNNDFFLQFISSDKLQNIKSFNASILPNTIGADIFLTVDRNTCTPLRTELLAGEAFSIKYYKEYVGQIEKRLSQLSHQVHLNKCAYLRIFVIENDICFLAFPQETTPVMRGEKHILSNDEESVIVSSSENDEVVYFDGWIRTQVIESEHKLVATAD